MDRTSYIVYKLYGLNLFKVWRDPWLSIGNGGNHVYDQKYILLLVPSKYIYHSIPPNPCSNSILRPAYSLLASGQLRYILLFIALEQ